MLRLVPPTLLLAAVACAGSTKTAPGPTPSNHAAPSIVRYRLDPIRIHDGMGRHSATQSWTTYQGTLEVRGAQAKLSLEMSTDHSRVRCPTHPQGVSRQACTPASSPEPSPTRQDRRYEGTFEQGNATRFAFPEGKLECSDDGGALSCMPTSGAMFGMGLSQPKLRFVRL